MKKNTDISVAVLQTDLVWIKTKLTDIETAINKVNLCTVTHDNRIQVLEDWKKASNEQWNKNMIKWGLIISAIAVLVSIVSRLFK